MSLPNLWIYCVGNFEGERIYDIILREEGFDILRLVETWVKESELRRRYPKLPNELKDMNIRPHISCLD